MYIHQKMAHKESTKSNWLFKNVCNVLFLPFPTMLTSACVAEVKAMADIVILAIL